jgi:microcystin degradation protein MlrC
MRRPRIAIAELSHETNAFARTRVDLAFVERCGIARGATVVTRAQDTATVLAGFIDIANELAFTLVPLLAVWITPAGLVTRDAYETLLGELIDRLETAAPVDGVLLSLHGAMVTEHIQDADGELLRRIRATVGQSVPIVAVLDLHANISPLMVEQADLLIGYHTYPHVDQRARGRQAGLALARLLDRTIHPTPVLVKPAMLPTSQRMTTDRPPMRTLMQHAEEWERHPRVVDVTIAGGFPPADVPEAGLSVLVTTDDDPALAAKVAEELAALAWDLRHGFLGGVATWEEAAEAIRHLERGPLVLVDIADNPWTGGPGDSVELLRFLLKEQVRPAALALVRDPEVVDECFRAGIGATVEVELGGKTDDLHGPPLRVRGTIRLLSDGRYVNAGPMHAGVTVDLGRTVVLRVEGIDVLVTERAESPIDLNVFRSHGIEPTEQRVIGLKGKGHFRAAFEPIAERVVLVEGPGITGSDLRRLPFRFIRRPIWPLDMA